MYNNLNNIIQCGFFYNSYSKSQILSENEHNYIYIKTKWILAACCCIVYMKEVPQLIYSISNRYFPFFKHFLNLEDFFHTRQENELFLSDPQGASEIYTYIRDTYIVHMLSIPGGICEQLCSAINRPGPDKFRSQYILYQQREEESWRERVLKCPVNLPWTFLIPDCVSVCVCIFIAVLSINVLFF